MIAIGLTAASLAGCGGGDTVTARAGPAWAVTSGTVLGSYFRNAKVCLDTNANAQCDSGETSVRSDTRVGRKIPNAPTAQEFPPKLPLSLVFDLF